MQLFPNPIDPSEVLLRRFQFEGLFRRPKITFQNGRPAQYRRTFGKAFQRVRDIQVRQ